MVALCRKVFLAFRIVVGLVRSSALSVSLFVRVVVVVGRMFGILWLFQMCL